MGPRQGPTLLGGHRTSTRLTITKPLRRALTSRRARRESGHPSMSSALLKNRCTLQSNCLINYLLQVCSGFPSLTYPPNTFGPGIRVQRVRVQTEGSAGRFWCGSAKGYVSPIATSPGGPRRLGLCRGDPRRPPPAHPSHPVAAAGPRRRRRRRHPVDPTTSPPPPSGWGIMLRASPPPPGPAPSPPVPIPLLTDLRRCSAGRDPVTSLAWCPRRRTSSPPAAPPPPRPPRRRRLGRGPRPRRRRTGGTLAARRPGPAPGAPFVGPGHPPSSGRPARHRARVGASRPADARGRPAGARVPSSPQAHPPLHPTEPASPPDAARLSTRRSPPLHPTLPASPPDGARLSTRRCPTANPHPDGRKTLRRGRGGEGGGTPGRGGGG